MVPPNRPGRAFHVRQEGGIYPAQSAYSPHQSFMRFLVTLDVSDSGGFVEFFRFQKEPDIHDFSRIQPVQVVRIRSGNRRSHPRFLCQFCRQTVHFAPPEMLGKTLSEAGFSIASDLCNGWESVWMGRKECLFSGQELVLPVIQRNHAEPPLPHQRRFGKHIAGLYLGKRNRLGQRFARLNLDLRIPLIGGID